MTAQPPTTHHAPIDIRRPFRLRVAGLSAALLAAGITACTTPSITDMRSVMRNGLLTAQVSLRKEAEGKPVGYRFKWLSASGVAVWDEEAWKPITVSAGQTINLIGVAPTPDAADFRFELTQYR